MVRNRLSGVRSIGLLRPSVLFASLIALGSLVAATWVGFRFFDEQWASRHASWKDGQTRHRERKSVEAKIQRIAAQIEKHGGRFDISKGIFYKYRAVDLSGWTGTDQDLHLVRQLKAMAEFDASEGSLWLSFSSARCTDAALAQLRGLPIYDIELNNSRISDAGLRSVAEYKDLIGVGLAGTRITGKGLAYVAQLPDLYALNLAGSSISDADLAQLKEFPSLGRLTLDRTKVSDAGMVHLGRCRKLRELSLIDTQVTDAGLAHLKGLPNLWDLRVAGTLISDDGIKDFRAALPPSSVSDFR